MGLESEFLLQFLLYSNDRAKYEIEQGPWSDFIDPEIKQFLFFWN